MSQLTHKQLYHQRLQNVCDYVYTNINQDLSLDQASQIAHFSKYHFHRQFSAFIGMPFYQFVQQVRIKQAAHQLVFQKSKKVLDIALDCGFDSSEAFARAFKKYYGVSPSQFRKQPTWKPWQESFQPSFFTTKEHQMSNPLEVNIVDFPDVPVAVLEHHGDPGLVNHSVEQFIEWRQTSGYSPIESSRTFGVPYQDPNEAAPETFQFDICGEESRPLPDNALGMVNKTLPGGRCAVARHLGSHDTMTATIYALYQNWLPESGESLRDFPCFFEFIQISPEVEVHKQITDIYLPLN